MRQVKTVNGIRRKILWGFVILGSLLFFSGLISFFELSKLSKSTQRIMDASVNDVEISKRMLDATQEQNSTLLQMVRGESGISGTELDAAKEKFEAAFTDAVAAHKGAERLQDIAVAWENYNSIVDQTLSDSTYKRDNTAWFSDIYRTSYYDLTLSIKNFMISTQHTFESNAGQLRNNAYRAIMPGIITLGIAIIIIFVFYALIDLYYIKPVLKITRSLGNYLHFKMPFNVKVEGQDEILQLKEYVNELMVLVKKKDQQRIGE